MPSSGSEIEGKDVDFSRPISPVADGGRPHYRIRSIGSIGSNPRTPSRREREIDRTSFQLIVAMSPAMPFDCGRHCEGSRRESSPTFGHVWCKPWCGE